jgi:hypothetical protein
VADETCSGIAAIRSGDGKRVYAIAFHRSIEMPARQHGLLDRYRVKPGAAAVIGPGLLDSVYGGPHANGLKLELTAARAVPAVFAREGCKEIKMDCFRVWL